jgi:hypothetical protein
MLKSSNSPLRVQRSQNLSGQVFKIKIMKKIVLAVLVLGIVTLFACKKNKDDRSQYPYVNLNDCINKSFGHDKIRLCFDQVISDSRCPEGMVCVWEGAATAKFTFTKDNVDHVLTLVTNSLNLPIARDTVVAGYKIQFVDLKPYPKQVQIPEQPYKAEVKITRL